MAEAVAEEPLTPGPLMGGKMGPSAPPVKTGALPPEDVWLPPRLPLGPDTVPARLCASTPPMEVAAAEKSSTEKPGPTTTLPGLEGGGGGRAEAAKRLRPMGDLLGGSFVSWVFWCYFAYMPALGSMARYLWSTMREMEQQQQQQQQQP
ncbi:hypothetical protein TSOC_001505 [Tetrabaena socialis]|uniref:Uncharacterized protein n=1 Tax=Tetrabaena socialis TaxID=47790 RepID=A0A2J8AGJ9_9CHLO|nr:hypothetical protein TSOC_001505 [Tetrabaena socialis]|eukprot:PNH11639.1 hypothetical protein TSOC_001505 [Tetrabaena socialis]